VKHVINSLKDVMRLAKMKLTLDNTKFPPHEK
jgi:hypothetical protein